MPTTTLRTMATAAGAITIACAAFALGAAMTSDSSSGAAPAPATTAASPGSSAQPTTQGSSAEAGSATTVAAAGGAAEAVAITNFAFGPAELSLAVGTTITWTNDDDVTHNVFSADNALASPDLDQGDTYEVTPDAAGTIEYYCAIHEYMKGTITVMP